MKTILNILIILVVAAIVSAGYILVVDNLSDTSALAGEHRPTGEMAERPQGALEGFGEHHQQGASFGRGLLEVGVTLAKLAGITVIVLLLERGVQFLIHKRGASPA